jgi:hypothetical protein
MSEAPDREKQLRSKVNRLVKDAGELLQAVQFARLTDEVRNRQTKLPDLRKELADIRAGGFRFKAGLEANLQEASDMAERALDGVLEETRSLASSLRPRIDELSRSASRLARSDDLEDREHVLDTLDTEHRGLERTVREAERRVRSLTEPFTKGVDAVKKGVGEATATLERFDEASFELQQGENPVATVDATWEDAPNGARKGTLLLSDQRVRFEHKESVVTKRKFIFFAAETKEICEVVLDEPVGHLASSDDDTRGMVFKDQVLAFSWSSGVKCPRTTTFELDKGTAAGWDDVVESVRSGAIAQDRTAPPEGVSDELLRFATSCESCGGSMPASVKGQVTLPCPFCGTVHQPIP